MHSEQSFVAHSNPSSRAMASQKVAVSHEGRFSISPDEFGRPAAYFKPSKSNAPPEKNRLWDKEKVKAHLKGYSLKDLTRLCETYGISVGSQPTKSSRRDAVASCCVLPSTMDMSEENNFERWLNSTNAVLDKHLTKAELKEGKRLVKKCMSKLPEEGADLDTMIEIFDGVYRERFPPTEL